MIINTSSATGQPSKRDPGYTIREPQKVVTDFTVKNDVQAAEALNLISNDQIADLKDFLKEYDMTYITNMELKEVGSKLFDAGLISDQAFSVFIQGTRAVDENGHQADLNVKFNAIALFDQRLEEQTAWLPTFSAKTKQEPLFVPWREGMIIANRAINALAYFANSSGKNFTIDKRA